MEKEILSDLGDGLILRRATPEDVDRLPDFDARIHGEENWPDFRIRGSIRDMLEGRSTSCPAQDFTIVEDTRRGAIVSSTCLISYCWSFAGIPIRIGQPEFVGTDPAYRNRGLVRKQFEVLHQWSRERGQLAQGITGIPYYYRQFGYEMAVDLDGGRMGYSANVPPLTEGVEEPYLFREPQESDLPFIRQCYDYGCQRSLVSAMRDEQDWRYELFGHSPESADRHEFRVITRRADGLSVGFIGFTPWILTSHVSVGIYELAPGNSWLEITPSVIRFLWSSGQTYTPPKGKALDSYGLMLGEEHPAYQAAAPWLPYKRDSYAWYVRIPDLKAFLFRVAPALENRLALSYASGYTGELTLGFYRSGLALKFEQGRLVTVGDFNHCPGSDPQAAFPGLTFLQLLLGYRSLAELEYAFPDCLADRSVRPLVNALFPKLPSHIWPII